MKAKIGKIAAYLRCRWMWAFAFCFNERLRVYISDDTDSLNRVLIMPRSMKDANALKVNDWVVRFGIRTSWVSWQGFGWSARQSRWT